MKKRIALLSILFAFCALILVPCTRINADQPFINNPRWHETTLNDVDSRYNAHESFIVVFFRQTCFNSNIRKMLLDDWMNEYQIDLYAVDIDQYSTPYWIWDTLGDNATLPIITIVDEGTAVSYDGNNSMRVINQAVLEFIGVYDGMDVDFYAADNAIYQAYAKDQYTAKKLYLKSASSISSAIVQQAQSVTAGLSSDSAKLKAIYDWVAENIYYDYGAFEGYVSSTQTAEEVYSRGMGVCAGYANLTQDMCHAVGIPCRVVVGFATGVGSDNATEAVWSLYKQYQNSGNLNALRNGVEPYENHAWNEAYVGGRWIILDTTWGSNNDAYYDPTAGTYGIIGAAHTDDYYDPDLVRFSESHLFLTDYSAVYPKVTKQPASVTASVGSTATFSVTASGTGLSYQWQYKKAGGSTWYNSSFTGATTATMSVPVIAARDGYSYRCVVKGVGGSKVYSNAATLTVKMAITSQPSNVTASIGDTAKFTVKASGAGLTYQWQYKKAGGSTWYNSSFTGSKTATMSVPVIAARDGYQYRCVVKDANGNTATSSGAKLTVKIKVTSQPQSVTAAIGDTVNYSVSATGVGLTYQWQYKKPGTTSWANSTFTGAQTASMSVQVIAARNGYEYRCVIKDANGKTVNSSAAMLTVEIHITTQPQSVTAAAGSSVNFSVRATGAGPTYQWQYKRPGTDKWYKSSFTGAQTNTMTVPVITARNGYEYRCVITDANGETVYSLEATLTVE